MLPFSKNFFFGIIIAILLITTIIFGVLWVQTKRELRSRNQELGELQKQLQELQTKFIEKTAVEDTRPEQFGPELTAEGLVEGWKTYRNEKYGFDVRYPSGIQPDITQDSFGITLEAGLEGIIGVNINAFSSEGEDIKGFSIRKGAVRNSTDFNQHCKIIQLSQTSAYECDLPYDLAGEHLIFVLKDDIFFKIEEIGSNDISEKVISTFKFLKS